MVFKKILSNKNTFSCIFLLVSLGLLIYQYYGLIEFIVYGAIITFIGLILYDLDFIIPPYLFLIGITAQLPEEYHHLFSYGMSAIVIWAWILNKVYHNDHLRSIIISDKLLIYFIIFHVSWNLICSLFSNHPFEGLYVTLRIAVFFLIIYIFYDWLSSKKRIIVIINTIIFIGLFASIFSLINFIQSGLLIDISALFRYGGIFTGANAFGFVLSVAIPLALSQLIATNSNGIRIGYIIIITILGLSLLLTFSRSAWLASFIACIYILFHNNLIRKIILLVSFVGFFITWTNENVLKQIYQIIRFENFLTHRDILWKAALEIINDHPITGVGPNSIKYYLVNYSGLNPNSQLGDLIQFAKNNSHNYFLTMGAELGLIGIIIAISSIGIFFYYYFTNLPYINVDDRIIFISCGAIVAGLLGRSFFEGNGILTNGWLSFDVYYWIIFAISLRFKQLSLGK